MSDLPQPGTICTREQLWNLWYNGYMCVGGSSSGDAHSRFADLYPPAPERVRIEVALDLLRRAEPCVRSLGNVIRSHHDGMSSIEAYRLADEIEAFLGGGSDA